MFKYFDKTFFKFLFGFVAIISASLAIVLATAYYEQSVEDRAGVSSIKEF